ncbi:MAG: hypothetical protein ABIT21_09875, partial [Terrimesophilobacter sp.]
MQRNIHERVIHAPTSEVGLLLDTLSSREDRFWPIGEWPRMRLDGPLAVGAVGGHGPVGYAVEEYEPGVSATFRFTAPSGFHGFHRLTATEHSADSTMLRHELHISPTGAARITWPLFFRPMHDALIEEAFDRVERETGAVRSEPSRRSVWVRFLRAA